MTASAQKSSKRSAWWILGSIVFLVVFSFGIVRIDIPEFDLIRTALTHLPRGSYLPVGAIGRIDTAMIGYSGSPQLCFRNAGDLDQFRADVHAANEGDRELTVRKGYLVADGTHVRSVKLAGNDLELSVRDGPSIGRVCWVFNAAIFDDVKTTG